MAAVALSIKTIRDAAAAAASRAESPQSTSQRARSSCSAVQLCSTSSANFAVHFIVGPSMLRNEPSFVTLDGYYTK